MKIDIGSKILECRAWKGKDKKAFLASLKEKKINEYQVMETLVYSCIEEEVVLSVEEFKYVLSRIRAMSLGEEITIKFYCQKCGEIFSETFLLKNILKYTYKELNEISAQGVQIKLGAVKNKKVYIEKISEDSVYDLLLRVQEFNGDSSFSLDELMDKFDDLELPVLEDIISQFEGAKFKVQDVNEVICPHCNDKVQYEFDELPEFFPETWFEV